MTVLRFLWSVWTYTEATPMERLHMTCEFIRLGLAAARHEVCMRLPMGSGGHE